MNEFIEKNSKLLKFYYILAQVIGWVILIVAGTDIIFALTGYHRYSSNIGFVMRLIDSILLGLIALGVGRFIRYIYDVVYKPSLLLRHLCIILYTYAGFKLIFTLGLLYIHLVKQMEDAGPYYGPWQSFFKNAIPVIAVTFIFIALGQILRRIIPVIEESRTLV